MDECSGGPEPFSIVEGGAGGRGVGSANTGFRADALLPEFYAALRYWRRRMSAKARRVLQSAAFEEPSCRGSRGVQREKLPETIAGGCVFSNELLDALPVHRVVMGGGELRKIYVDAEGDRLVERRMPDSSAGVAEYFRRSKECNAEGQRPKRGSAACRWIEEVGRRLGRGFVLTIDYGREAREFMMNTI